MRGQPKERIPLNGVSSKAIFEVFHATDKSWFDKAQALEDALVAAGWTPPPGGGSNASASTQPAVDDSNGMPESPTP